MRQNSRVRCKIRVDVAERGRKYGIIFTSLNWNSCVSGWELIGCLMELRWVLRCQFSKARQKAKYDWQLLSMQFSTRLFQWNKMKRKIFSALFANRVTTKFKKKKLKNKRLEIKLKNYWWQNIKWNDMNEVRGKIEEKWDRKCLRIRARREFFLYFWMDGVLVRLLFRWK